ncbi:Y-family DNA polymerase [Acinetobacter bouvetii]|uniref:DNA polymerase V subunit UmuC n=1 Tax=Acinetobacter bouvetii TaxID=202951 RepID=A0A811GHY5_9GAMM|nr:Y-family DNA polymerase [Acinetobacter bouvetii]CAB1221442.1 DNA polymerase V subunit UmuC [Acinetobacter bouvetii]
MPQQLFALIDINNCYVSCERAFNPKLNGQPVVVLSNNDGCVVSRSNEAKALNIGMAVPWYEIEQTALKAGVKVFSSNYALYGDMSRRFFTILEQHFHPDDLEPYSIDECFIQLGSYAEHFDLEQYCRHLIKIMEQWIGLPCCIGVGTTKTQAKLANYFAKKRTGFDSVCYLPHVDLCSYESLLQETPVAEIWGIGRKISKQLQDYEIYNAYDLTFANEHHLGKQFSVMLARTIRELKGQSCIALDDPQTPSKRILSSRSFAAALTEKNVIKQAVIFHVNQAYQRLIKQQQLCACVHVSLYEKIPNPPYKKSISYALGLEYASDDLLTLNHAALKQIDVLFKENKKYIKVEIMLSALCSKQHYMHDLWQPLERIQQRDNLMQALLKMKQRYGQDCIQIGYHSRSSAWQMKQQYRSPRYTTCWQELLTINDPAMAITQNK